jgi:Alginate export
MTAIGAKRFMEGTNLSGCESYSFTAVSKQAALWGAILFCNLFANQAAAQHSVTRDDFNVAIGAAVSHVEDDSALVSLTDMSDAAITISADGECQCPECQAKRAQADVKKAMAAAYAPLFYNNNFAYINNPAYTDWYPGDHFKQMPIGDCWMIDMGGQYRARYQDEQNMRGLGLTGRDDNFLLHRTRIFANAHYSDWFRFYAEYIDAESNYENFPSRLIEVNRSDMLNLFAGDDSTHVFLLHQSSRLGNRLVGFDGDGLASQ